MKNLNVKLLKTISLSLLFCFMSATAVEAAERECSQTILFVPQLHNQGNDIARSSSLTQRRDEHFKATVKNQLKIYYFLKEQNAAIPIFYEGFGENQNEKTSKFPLFPERYGISNSLSGKGFESLTEPEKAALYNYGAPTLLLIYGDRKEVRGTAPSLDDHLAIHASINKEKEKLGDKEITLDSNIFKFTFTTRDQWALIEAMKYFKANPKMPYALMVYGASHNFRAYEKFLPEGYCVGTLGIFDEYYKPGYEVKSAELLQNYLKENP